MDGPQRKDMPNWLIPLLQWGLPFIVTVGGLLIAWRQVEINRRQIRFQFHEKRLCGIRGVQDTHRSGDAKRDGYPGRVEEIRP
jgi:hypothetical protein